MSKKKNKDLRNDVYETIPTVETNYNKQQQSRPRYNNNNSKRERPEPPEVAKLLCRTIVDQITDFLSSYGWKDRLNDLFTLGDRWPAGIAGCEGTENLLAYQVERTVRLDRDDPEKIRRMSTSIVVIDNVTAKPVYYLTAYISPNMQAGVQVYTMGDRGPDYRKTIRWNNRNSEKSY